MSLIADYQSLKVVLRYSELPTFESGTHSGVRIIVASIGKVARWSGSAWVLSAVETGIGAASVASAVSFSAGSNLTGVDGAGSNAAPLAGTETRLDAIDTAIAAIIANLQAAGLMA